MFVQQPSASFINMNSPQMFNYQSPTTQCLQSGKWIISPFNPSTNMNLLYTPIPSNIHSCSNCSNSNENESLGSNNHNVDEIKKEHKEHLIEANDKNIGTMDVTHNEIGIGTENGMNYKCEICDKLLICPQHLLNYNYNYKENENMNMNMDKEWKCFECDDKFKNKVLLQSHLKNAHNDMIKNIQSLFGVKF